MRNGMFVKWEPDPVGQILATGYNKFESVFGICGLAREPQNGLIEILAVHANTEGCGQLRRFVAGLKKRFDVIKMWHLLNDDLGMVLARYDFEPLTEIQDGEEMSGMQWTKRKSPRTVPTPASLPPAASTPIPHPA